MNEKKLIRITIDEMIAEMLGHIRNDTYYPTYYWKHEDKGFLEIVECNLISGRIIMEDGDFSDFTWEMDKDSNIYRLAI